MCRSEANLSPRPNGPAPTSEHIRRFDMKAFFYLAIAALSLMTTACAVRAEDAPSTAAKASAEPQAKDIVDTAVAAGNFKTLAAALQAAGLVDTLKGPGPFT